MAAPDPADKQLDSFGGTAVIHRSGYGALDALIDHYSRPDASGYTAPGGHAHMLAKEILRLRAELEETQTILARCPCI